MKDFKKMVYFLIGILISNLISNKIFKLIFNYNQREPHEQRNLDTAIGYKIDRFVLTMIVFLIPYYIRFTLGLYTSDRD